MSWRKPDGAHTAGKLPGAARIELAVEEAADFGGPGTELLGEDFRRITLTCQPGFEIVSGPPAPAHRPLA